MYGKKGKRNSIFLGELRNGQRKSENYSESHEIVY